MNSPCFPRLRASHGLAVFLGLYAIGLAADETVTGNLEVTGNTDLSGNILSFGTAGTDAGLNLSYTDGTPASLYFSATRNGTNWLWQTNTSKTQLKLGATNQLQLFDQATTPVAKITLDPLGTSIFSNSVIIRGTDNQLPYQALTDPSSILTQSLADERYLRNSATSPGGIVLGAGSAVPGSVAICYGQAIGANSFAIAGSAQGPNSVAISDGIAMGDGAFAMGWGQAEGQYSIAMGPSSRSHNFGSAALSGGYSTGWMATALSSGGASGANATGMSWGSASGYASTAMSFGNASGEWATAMSLGTASGPFSAAIGPYATAQGVSQVAVGGGNIPQGSATQHIPTDDLFIVGNGSFDPITYISGPPSNALTVHKNGNMRVLGTVQSKGGFRTPPMGDLSMGTFTAGANPADLNAGLRYSTE